MKRNKRHIIYITGETAQGKTTFAQAYAKELNAYLISTDKAYNLSKYLDDSTKDFIDTLEHNKYTDMFYEVHGVSSEDYRTVIIEGSSVASADERRYIESFIHPEYSYMLKLESDEWSNRAIKKYNQEVSQYYKEWFNSIYTPHTRTYIVNDEQELIKEPDYQKNSNMLLKWEALKNHLGDLNNKSVLDLGCNAGDLYKYLSEAYQVEYYGLDVGHRFIEEAFKKYPLGDFYLLDALEWTKEIDVVISLSTLHIFNDQEFENVIEHYSKLCNRFIFEVPVNSKNPLYYSRSEEQLNQICSKYFSNFKYIGVSPSPHDTYCSTRNIYDIYH